MKLGLIAVLVLLPSTVLAQPAGVPGANAPTLAGTPQHLVGVDFQFSIPVGNFSDVAGVGFGGLLHYEFRAIPFLPLTARAGYSYYLSKTQDVIGGGAETQVSVVPVLVGAKYFVIPNLYVGAEVGLAFIRTSVDLALAGVGDVENSDTDTKFAASLGAGYEILHLGPGLIDLRAKYEVLSLGDFGDTMQVVITVGYLFGL